MCDTKPHNTGWKVIRVTYNSYYGYSKLFMRCRTEHCVEVSVKEVEGYWTARDFDD